MQLRDKEQRKALKNVNIQTSSTECMGDMLIYFKISFGSKIWMGVNIMMVYAY